MVINDFLAHLERSIDDNSFVKITCSKPTSKNRELRNIYVRLVSIKKQQKLSFTYRYKTNDQVKNYSMEESLELLNQLFKDSFKIATLFTTEADYQLQIGKNDHAKIKKIQATFTAIPDENHDRAKKKRADYQDSYLYFLGVTNSEGKVIPKMADKYRQINKYLETIEDLMKSTNLPKEINVVDMGSGKGYLTFALYDYLYNKLKLNVKIVGVELRSDLVNYCNDIAQKCNFEFLTFESRPIESFDNDKIDILIALHACDTATDDAIKKGIFSKAALIICAPCCHKQIRQQLKGKEQESPILKYGIFKERQFEMVTDTIRALILEKHQYQTKIFEFISNEHTRKNIMLVASKSTKKANTTFINDKISSIKNQFGIDHHYLEKVVPD